MKCIIAGPRWMEDHYSVVEQAVALSGIPISEVVSGKARGIDTLGEVWAARHSVPVQPFPADWKKHGKYAAGPIRNSQMQKYAEAAVIIWDGVSSGSLDMIRKAKKGGLRTFIYLENQHAAGTGSKHHKPSHIPRRVSRTPDPQMGFGFEV